MKTCPRTGVALALALVAVSPGRAADTFDLDQSHFSIVFSVSHMNLSYTYGFFRQAQGSVVLDKENPANTQFQLTINADSIDTNEPQRDQHLKSPDFLNVQQFPTITFQSTSVVLDTRPQQGIVYQVTGNLTMHGVTRQIVLPIQLMGEGPGVGGRDYRAGFVSQFELKRSEFGMTNALDMVGDAIGITVSFEAIRQGGAAPGR